MGFCYRLLPWIMAFIFFPFQFVSSQPVYRLSDTADLRDMIGQMLMVGYGPGTQVPDTLYLDITERNLGGVILMGYNVESPQSLRGLTEELQLDAMIPLFISTDQEGGRVARLNRNNGYEDTHTAEYLGNRNSSRATREQAAMMAGWLKDGGVNVNLAPVVDVNVNPSSPAIGNLNRSFSSDPAMVTKHAGLFIEEFDEAGILTALKHFPGHGSAERDSHLGFTDITNTWIEEELEPYEELINRGYRGMIMPGHLYHEVFDSLHPATLSENTLRGKLRDELGFEGVIISDGMFMRAIQDHYGFFESVKLAINAGIDILLYTGNMHDGRSLVRQIIDFVEKEVNEGRIDYGTIASSYDRIIRMKQEWIPTSVEPLAEAPDTPDRFGLRNYPNPFNPSTNIRFDLPARQHATLTVYDLQGRRVQELANGTLSAGPHQYRFDAGSLTSGVYLCVLETGGVRTMEKMLLIR